MEIKDGTLLWRMGHHVGCLPPNDNGDYLKDNITYFRPEITPEGITFPIGKGSFKKSFQFYGNKPNKNIDISLDLGWAKVHVLYKDSNLDVSVDGGKDAVNKRWDMELTQVDRFKGQDIILRNLATILGTDYSSNYYRDKQRKISPIAMPQNTIPITPCIPESTEQVDINNLKCIFREQTAKDQQDGNG